MSQSTICPYCNTRLRLSSSSHRRSRVKCRKCDRGFFPSQIIENDGPTEYLNQPLQVHSANPVDSPRIDGVAASPSDSPAASASPPPPVDADSPPATINPKVAEAAFPKEMLERRARRRASSERVRERTSLPKHRMKTHEILLAVGLLAAGVSGAAYLGWYLLRPATKSVAMPESPTLSEASEAVVSPPSLLERDFAQKPLPKRLIGRWELRNDDDRRGWFEFRPDHTMTAYAWVGDQQAEPTRDNWFLNQESGDDVVIEIGQQIGVIGNFKYHLTMTGPDAFTITLITEKDTRYRENQRFVRRAPPSTDS